jgi:hypothetical protein
LLSDEHQSTATDHPQSDYNNTNCKKIFQGSKTDIPLDLPQLLKYLLALTDSLDIEVIFIFFGGLYGFSNKDKNFIYAESVKTGVWFTIRTRGTSALISKIALFISDFSHFA